MHCEGKPHLWVSEDGTYEEEANKKEKSKIWDKVSLHTDEHWHACFT